jgi:hypothetical protein
MTTTTAALRHGLLGVLTAAALGGAATASLTGAVGDRCDRPLRC